MEIVIASTSLHKTRELRDMFKSQFQMDVRGLHDFPQYTAPELSAEDFQANASAKALHAAQALNRWTIGDESGLVVPALQENPKITQRYIGTKDTAQGNRAELLEKLREKVHLSRSAFFICSLTLAGPQGIKKTVTSICEGFILPEERGNNGYGFDSLFAKHDYDKSFAEFEAEFLNRISHRRKAFDKLIPSLESLLK